MTPAGKAQKGSDVIHPAIKPTRRHVTRTEFYHKWLPEPEGFETGAKISGAGDITRHIHFPYDADRNSDLPVRLAIQ